MDIIVPEGLDFAALGGQKARYWANCSEYTTEVFENVIKPHVTGLVTPRFNIVEEVTVLPSRQEQEPVTYVLGNDGSWVVTTSELRERIKPSSRMKDFEAAKRTGKIALNPLLNCRLFGSATPKILHSTLKADSPLNYAYRRIGAVQPGICNRLHWAWPSLEADSGGGVVRVNRKRYNDVTVAPVPISEIDRILRAVKSRLDSIEPEQSLVTKVVSEANAATWDIATEVAEMPETIKYIMNGVKQGILLLLRAKREIKQNLSSGGVKTDIASIWMQYRYAIMPIVYGVNDALDVLGMDAVKFQSFRGRKDTPLFGDETEFAGYSIRESVNYENRVFLKYKYDIDSKIHQGLQINFAATAWELLPLSFVFDWFFQVGDYLTAAFRPGVVSAHGCQQSVKCKGSLVLEGNSSEVLTIDIEYYRCRNLNPDAFIGINSDVFISFKRAMDAIALSWLLFGKKRRG